MNKRLLIAFLIFIAGAVRLAAAPDYVFLFIGDGMGPGHVMATIEYLRQHGQQDSLLMCSFPVTGLMTTFSASSPVTDSAAAGTAMACGAKTSNRMLGVLPDGTAVKSVATRLHEQGYGVGLVTTVAPDDATPAAFYAHVRDRSQFDSIACDAVRSGFEFIGGADLRCSPAIRKNFAAGGVDVVRGEEACRRSEARRKVLLNTDSTLRNDLGYAVDAASGVLTLPVITRLCLEHLCAQTPDRFFMMVEGGSIDHAAHANDGATVIKEVLEFNKAIGTAYDFYRQHPDNTLIIVTADHDTGGMATVGYGGSLSRADMQKMSMDRFNERCMRMLNEGGVCWEDMKRFIDENFGADVMLGADEEEELHRSFSRTFESGSVSARNTTYASYLDFTVTLFRLLDSAMCIRWITNEHTANPVPIFAIGAGSHCFGGMKDNTELMKCIYGMNQTR